MGQYEYGEKDMKHIVVKQLVGKLAQFRALLSVVVLSLLVSNVAFGGEHEAELVRQAVEKNVTELVDKFDRERQYYETDPERFFSSMDQALGKIVDFRRIAARVMGKYARKASREQRDRFVAVFKDSLYETYTKTLVESGAFKINVIKAKINSRSDKRATVDLEVVSDNGSVYPVVYSMHRTKSDEWLMENVIVFGVNIGLAFRDKFESQMRRNKGDVDAVIGAWTAPLDIKKPKES